ncbi:MAG: TetR/AcrR family transcriptional regulator [Gammaproteobacteria bacterium]|nr:TetR/AcrR family transcriptional regulator [Gammaproteobacteria bacterium]
MASPSIKPHLLAPTLNRPNTEATARILTAAGDLFAEHGFAAVSMHAIAERADVSKANIFHHFSSKRELYLAVLRHACRDATEHLQQLETPDGTFQERFSAYAVDMLAGMLQRERLHRLAQRALLAEDNGQLARELAERVFGERFGRLVAILRAGQRRGELRVDFDPAMAAVALIGGNLFFLQSRNVFQHFPDVGFAADPTRYSELLADILLRGMLAPAAQSNNNSNDV